MTNAEAIATLTIMQMNKAMNVVEALDIAIAALREKADKERRYVVHEDSYYGPYRVCDIGLGNFHYVANRIPTREAAQSIADIYEGVKQ